MNEQIAKILDSIKTSSPIVHAIIIAVLVGAHQLFIGADFGDPTTMVSALIEYAIAYFVNARTKRHLKGASILSNCQCKDADD